ncbi:MAG: transcriptional regulator [Candidatus Zixiibacteriota bacterium]
MPATEIKQVDRIIQILQRLALTGEITVRELYEYFQRRVPKRTLQRDLISLSAANIPLVTRPGEGRELIWYLDKTYLRFIPETLGSQELLASFFVERLARIARGTALEGNVNSLLKKSRQLVAPQVFRSFEGGVTSDVFGSTFTGYVDYGPHSEKIDRVLTAASQCRRCRITYRRIWKEKPSQFDADPYMLVYHKGALYALVHVPRHDNFIFLPIQRIRDVEVTKAKFVRDPSFSLENLKENRFGIFGHSDLKPEKVVLKFRPDIADVVAERIWHPTQKLKRHRDGSLTLTMTVVISDELRSWVAGWLEYVRVLKPEAL